MADYMDPAPAGLRALQLIVTALVAGGAIFAAIVALAPPAPGQAPSPAGVDVLRIVCAALIVGAVPIAVIVHQMMLRGAARRGRPHEVARSAGARPADLDGLFRRFQAATLASAALLEAPALLAIIVYLLGRRPVDLALAAIPIVVLILAVFPTSGRWRRVARQDGVAPMSTFREPSP